MLRKPEIFRTGLDALERVCGKFGKEYRPRQKSWSLAADFGRRGIWAQVAERLMAADCKSAAPWSYGGSNPPLCTTRVEDVRAGLGDGTKLAASNLNDGLVKGSGSEPAEDESGLSGRTQAAEGLEKRFRLALLLYGILGLLVWFTMGEGKVLVQGRPVELRLVPLIVLGGLALRTVVARHAEKIRQGGKGRSSL